MILKITTNLKLVNIKYSLFSVTIVCGYFLILVKGKCGRILFENIKIKLSYFKFITQQTISQNIHFSNIWGSLFVSHTINYVYHHSPLLTLI